MRSHPYMALGIALGVIVWILESTFLWLFFGKSNESITLLPRGYGELVLRSILSISFPFFGMLVDLLNAEAALKEIQKKATFRVSLSASNHIVNNFLNQMQLFRFEIENNGNGKPSQGDTYDAIVDEAVCMIKKLEQLPDISEKSVQDAILVSNELPKLEEIRKSTSSLDEDISYYHEILQKKILSSMLQFKQANQL